MQDCPIGCNLTCDCRLLVWFQRGAIWQHAGFWQPGVLTIPHKLLYHALNQAVLEKCFQMRSSPLSTKANFCKLPILLSLSLMMTVTKKWEMANECVSSCLLMFAVSTTIVLPLIFYMFCFMTCILIFLSLAMSILANLLSSHNLWHIISKRFSESCRTFWI